jgi:hypothetical protein
MGYDILRIARTPRAGRSYVDVTGRCQDDGQIVWYTQEAQFFELRVFLFWCEHPRMAAVAAVLAVAEAALEQHRRKALDRAECPD